ncbi:membrane protein [Mesorhizobium sp. L-8-10]|uniref:tripartite tricarboxylate transporter TctB family protein n=1 Tax=unclassified Mesorhizobium TaxID=325217 RepID=UPI00192519C9|nr:MULTISPECIES: tripartite tricarboxylate transporter TctB family protein [unclassified Mesorhizobium]BCH25386.1 membrane protein [Mesorhizobium sp. L-8-3]BCH33395.1 membrane protein [Mesorhizobium sp. L-8-10]
MKSLRIDPTNGLCGALFLVVGLFFLVQSVGLEIGTAFRMGPGYFPLVLSGVLIVLGLVILVQATKVESEPIGPIAWRGMLLILPAPILFGLTVRGFGFVPAVFISALVASFASTRMTPLMALVLAAALTAFSVVVFSYGLGLPYQRFGPWLRF